MRSHQPVSDLDQLAVSSVDDTAEPSRRCSGQEPVLVDSVLPLYTPARAAELLAVRESWLRRRATERRVPCTFLGKHLRFSQADLVEIATAAARPSGPPPRTLRVRSRRPGGGR